VAENKDPRRFLDPKVLSKISRLDIVARLVVEGFVTGLHKSPYHGFSVEFAEHREYVAGDDIKHIDWKVFGRSDRYYIKQYEEETNLSATILLDISESMKYKSDDAPMSKLDYGSTIAASLAFLILQQRDTVGLVTFDDQIREWLPPSAHPSHRNLILNALNSQKPEKKTGLGKIFHEVADRVKRKGLVIIISDFLDDAAKIIGGLRHLKYRRHEIIVFHLMDPCERNFPFESMTTFKGLEDLGSLITNPKALRRSYLEEIENHIWELKRGCRQDRIDYVELLTSQPLDIVLTQYLATRAEMKLA
jgi:uncharacterized protein (DUF58 family)